MADRMTHPTPSHLVDELAGALEELLNSCGARGTYDAFGYRESVERAEAALRARAATEGRDG